ncbi:MAG: hypothetical protein IPF88_11880 [Candidatus Microthrix sp.]|nr:PIN domain-containing protein [Candidatus Microthrix sp.]MBK6439270.1 hypothetical protein [Candidatus Microthrix sp.]
MAVLLERRGHWPPVVSTMTMVEALQGRPGPDAPTNQFLKSCRIEPVVSERLARRAARLRTSAGRGSAVDALIVALAEPGGVVVTGDSSDICALAERADDVYVQAI